MQSYLKRLKCNSSDSAYAYPKRLLRRLGVSSDMAKIGTGIFPNLADCVESLPSAIGEDGSHGR